MNLEHIKEQLEAAIVDSIIDHEIDQLSGVELSRTYSLRPEGGLNIDIQVLLPRPIEHISAVLVVR